MNNQRPPNNSHLVATASVALLIQLFSQKIDVATQTDDPVIGDYNENINKTSH